jgi:hypothetical protein
MTYYLGVDPGKNGALALLSIETGSVNCIDMPDTTAALHDAISGFPIIKGCMVEKPYYPQMIGVTNAAKIAMAYGVLIGALQWRDISFREVPPKKWKAAMDLSSSKSASREKAAQTFPAQSDLFKRVKDDGRAEAALLALYAADNRRRWQG